MIDIQRHGDTLDASGISVESAKLAGLESTDEGLEIPYFDPIKGDFNGFSRVRLDRPTAKGQKYVQPTGSQSRLYHPPLGAGRDPKSYNGSALPIFIVEGEKKALSLQQRLRERGLVIGLGGVWNWCAKRKYASDGPRPLIADFGILRFAGRTAYIIFDSDVATNSRVRQAEEDLSKSLNAAGMADVKLVTLPPSDGSKMGIDDWLVEWDTEWEQELGALCKKGLTSRVELPTIYSFDEMLNVAFPPIKVLLGSEDFPILNSGGLCYVHSMSGIGKTYFSMQMAHALSNGRSFLGHAACTPLRIVFLQAELSAGWFQRRVRSLEKCLGPAGEIAVMNGQVSLAVPAPYGKYEVDLLPLEQIIQNYKADVVFLDPLQGFMDIPENSTDVNREFQRQLARLRHKYECAMVLTHHDRKSVDGEGMHRMRGSSVLSDWADCVFSIDRVVEDVDGEEETVPDRLKLSYDKVRHAEGPRPESIELVRLRHDGRSVPWLGLPPASHQADTVLSEIVPDQ